MPRTQIRAALTEFFLNQAIPYVGTVYPARAYLKEQDYEQNAMSFYTQSINGSGCVLVINLPKDDRVREAMSGRGAVNDKWVHPVDLELFFANTSGDPVVAQVEYDQSVDAMVIAIRSNPLLGDPQDVWSAGEFEYGVRHRQSQPFTGEDGLTVFIYGVVSCEVWEWIAGPVPQ